MVKSRQNGVLSWNWGMMVVLNRKGLFLLGWAGRGPSHWSAWLQGHIASTALPLDAERLPRTAVVEDLGSLQHEG